MRGYSDQVFINAKVVSGGTTETVLRTIPAGKALYIKSISLSGAGGSYVCPEIRQYNSVGTLVRVISSFYYYSSGQSARSALDIIVPEGHELRLYPDSGTNINVNIHGFEV